MLFCSKVFRTEVAGSLLPSGTKCLENKQGTSISWSPRMNIMVGTICLQAKKYFINVFTEPYYVFFLWDRLYYHWARKAMKPTCHLLLKWLFLWLFLFAERLPGRLIRSDCQISREAYHFAPINEQGVSDTQRFARCLERHIFRWWGHQPIGNYTPTQWALKVICRQRYSKLNFFA